MSFEGAQNIGIWVLCFIAIIPVIREIRSWFAGPAKQEIHPQPLEVKETVRYATHEELKRLENEFHSFRKELKHEFQELSKAGEHRLEAINERLNQLAEDLPMRFLQIVEGRLR